MTCCNRAKIVAQTDRLYFKHHGFLTYDQAVTAGLLQPPNVCPACKDQGYVKCRCEETKDVV